MSAMLLLNFVLRMVFNIFKQQGCNLLTPDKFLNIDVVFAISNAIIYWYITMQPYQVFADRNQKDQLDFLVVFVLMLNWGRFFMLFLVIPSVSKMLLTLVAMLVDVGPFAFIMACYCLIVTQLFSTQY